MRKQPTDEDVKKFLTAKIQSSGFSLENKVEKILKKKYHVRREVPFHDLDEGKGRNCDFHANKIFPDVKKFPKDKLHSVGQYRLIIECKNVDGNIWVFSKDQSYNILLPDHVSINDGKKPDPVFNVSPFEPISDIPYASGYDEYVFDKRHSNKAENLYSAITTVTKSARYEKDTQKKLFDVLKQKLWNPTRQNFRIHFVFLQPVIVFSGRIFITSFSKNDEIEITPTEWVQIRTNYVSKHYEEMFGSIHIVTFNVFEKYLRMIDRYYRKKENQMIKDSKIFSDCYDLALKRDNWNS